MILEWERQNTRHWNKKMSINKTRVDRRNRKRQKKNRKQILHIKMNWEKAHAISVKILDIFSHNSPKQNLFQKINGNSKKQHKNYVLSRRSLNRNMETKNINQQIMKKTICWNSAHGQQEPEISFKHRVYSHMYWVILLGVYISNQMNNKAVYQKKASKITSYLKVDP